MRYFAQGGREVGHGGGVEWSFMRIHPAALTVLALVLAAPTAADAAPRRKPAPKPLCNLVVDDAKNDGNSNLLPGVSSQMVDILSADVATSKNELVAVLRLAKTSTDGETWTRLGYEWAFGSNANGTAYAFRARLTGGGDWITGVQIGDTAPKYTFTIDHATKSFVWRVPRKGIGAMTRPKLTWTKFSANSSIFSSTADNMANPDARYPDLHPSCVKAK